MNIYAAHIDERNIVTEVAVDDWRAIVEGWVAVMVPDGLGVPCDPPPSPDFFEEISEEL
jgi:hypothetical protein